MACSFGQILLALLHHTKIAHRYCCSVAWLCAAAGRCPFGVGRHCLVSRVYLADLGGGEQRMLWGGGSPGETNPLGTAVLTWVAGLKLLP